MSDGQIDSDDWESDNEYIFRIPPLTHNISQLESLEYLQTYIIQAELDMDKHIENDIKYGYRIDQHNYDSVIKFISSNKIGNSDQINLFETIYENTIFGFKSHLNEELLISGLRFLFIFSDYFNVIDAVKRDELINELIKLVLTQEEPVSTFAIKCLQMATNIFKKKLKIPLFKKLSDTLIERISAIIELNTHNILIPVLGLKFVKDERRKLAIDPLMNELSEKDIEKLGIKFSNTSSRVNVNINGCTQIFHHVALLQYLIPHLEISELMENPLFFDLFYPCLNITICKMDDIVIIMLTIIYDLIENQNFMFKFFNTKGISRICVIPYCLISSMYVRWILDGISQKFEYVKFLLKNHFGEFKFAIKYCINYLNSSGGNEICNFIINIFVFPEFYQLFIREKGIKLIFENISKNDIFDQIKDADYSISDIIIEYRNIEDKILSFLKILLSHIFIQISKITPSKIINSIPFIEHKTINYHNNDILIDYFESIGGFKAKIDFFEELLEVDTFEVIVSILRMTCRGDIINSNLIIYKDIMYCIKFLSLYHKSKSLFIHPFDPCPKQLKQGNDLIVFFRRFTEENIHCQSLNQLELSPFDIYHNLLVSCFSDFKTYEKIMKLEYEESTTDQETEKSEFDKESSLFMDRLIHTGFIYQILTYLPDMKLTLNKKILAIKCLLMMLTHKTAIQMVSAMKQKFIPKFEHSLITIANSKNSNNKTRSFIIYSLRLIYKLNRYGYFKFIDHTTFQPFLSLGREKVEQSLNNQYSFHKNKKINNQHQLEDSKIVKKVFETRMIDESKNQTLNSYFDLIPHIYQTNKPYLRRTKILEKLMTSNNIAFEKRYRCGQNSSINKIKLNSYKSICNKFNKVLFYVEKSSNAKIYNAKQLIDDSLLIATQNGIFQVPYDEEPLYIHSTRQVHNLDDSYNGEFIIGCGTNDLSKSRFTDIWKYDPTKHEHSIAHKNSYNDLNYSKITHDNLNIFGINSDYNALIIDIETSKIVSTFVNERLISIPIINCAATNHNDNLLLFNGELFCLRSDKFIHSFAEFEQRISGNFVHSDTKALINSELWDIRTLKLYSRMDKFKNFLVKKTYNDYILMGIELKKNIRINSTEDRFWYWNSYTPPYKSSFSIYDAKTFSIIGKINFEMDIDYANISRDCTKIAVGFNSLWYSQLKNYFKLIEIGNKEAEKTYIYCSEQ